MIHFDLPKEQSSILKVIGIGGGGSNAVNHMYSQNIDGVNFIICNTDAQAISNSKVPNKVQLGPHLTQGLGAGANPEIGREATEESLEEIKKILEVNTKMAFITAGMGGGTGTGGAPIIAKICKDLDILTVGIVTTPFAYEGKKRIAQAEEGINKLKDHVDTLLVISNDKLRHQFGNLTMKAAFTKADNVLATAAKCITDVINSTGQINVDFADVCTVMRNGGVAILGSAECEGENRAQLAIEQALNSPLLNDNDIRGAKWILININSAEGDSEFTMDEVETIQNHLLSQAGEDSDVILGLGYDNSLENKIGITLIATGFDHKEPFDKKAEPEKEVKKEEKVMVVLEQVDKKHLSQPLFLFDEKNEEIVNENEEVEEENILEQKGFKTLKDEDVYAALQKDDEENKMMPKIVKAQQSAEENLQSFDNKITVDQTSENKIYFELSIEPDPKKSAISGKAKKESENPAQNIQSKNTNKDASTVPTSGGYLAKPSQIYAEEKPKHESKSVDEPTPLQIPKQEDEPEKEMQLVVKKSHEAVEDEKEKKVHQTMPIMISPVEEPPMVDEADELKRRAMDRIAKLRNLSFNVNAADPNNEFESVPAYLRRNMELHNSIADVESFYSNYTVKSDENNKAEISTINTFLDGKKPD
ncbi:MAG: cell division protein FtsZ [Bacteroidota bacterium]|jgi:cell division protein FtsZ|nr:cell division protein FtsZ [Bacteroidota bacterium]